MDQEEKFNPFNEVERRITKVETVLFGSRANDGVEHRIHIIEGELFKNTRTGRESLTARTEALEKRIDNLVTAAKYILITAGVNLFDEIPALFEFLKGLI